MSDLSTRVDALFARAVALTTEEQVAFLDRECGGDQELRRRLDALLAADREAGSFLGRPIAAVTAGAPAAVRVGQRVGSYRLLRHLASGGMGEVFVGTRDDRVFERLVAVKVLDRHVDDEEMRRRFALERRILASLEHPGIARLYDAGELAGGQPYLVMELVDGVPVDRYCADRDLALERVLALGVEILEALAYAHRNLIVHRDLKPGNVLVAADGRSKLLDFGIAKLLVSDASDPATRAGPQPRTPAFAAPEQAAGGPVTTATDTFAMGVVLYRLICGLHPRATRREHGPVAPRAPSRAVVAAEATPVRGATPERLRGDVDAVLLKALEARPADRYPTADALADDLRSLIERRPVRARPLGLWGGLGRLARRNRFAAASAGLALVSVLALLVGTTLQSRRLARERDAARSAQAEAEHERKRAEQVVALLSRTFASADPYRAPDPDLTLREVLDRADGQAAELAAFPATRGDYFHVLGQLRSRLGMIAESEPLLRQALRLRRRHLRGDDPRLYETYDELVSVLRQRGDLARAEQLARLALAAHAQTGGRAEVAAGLRGTLALVMADRGQPDRALALNARSIATLRAARPHAAMLLIDALHNRGVLTYGAGDYTAARDAFQASIALRRRHETAPSLALAKTLGDLASAQWQLGSVDQAAATLREVLALQVRHLGEGHPEVARTLNNLGGVEDQRGSSAAAISAHCRALSIRRRVYGPRHETVGRSLNNVAHALLGAGDRQHARAAFERAESVWLACCEADGRDLAVVRSNRAKLAALEGSYRAAASLLASSIEIGERAWGADLPAVGDYNAGLAWIRLEEGSPDRAATLARRAREIYRVRLPEEHARVRYAEVLAAAAASAAGRGAEAAESFAAALPAVAEGQLGTSVRAKSLLMLRAHVARWGASEALEPYLEATASARLAPPPRDFGPELADCPIAGAGAPSPDVPRVARR